jgi:hypothetical protein
LIPPLTKEGEIARRTRTLRATAPRHIHWRLLRTYTTSYIAKATQTKPQSTVVIHSVREPPRAITLNTGHGKRKFEAQSIKTRLTKVIIVASTKNRKKAVTDDELEEIEGLEEMEVEDEELEDEVEDEEEEEPEDEDEDEEEEEAPAPKVKKTTKTKVKVKGRDDGKVGTAEVAAHFNIDGRTLRMVLRKHGIPTNSETHRYEWNGLDDKTVVKIGKLIASGEAKAVKQDSLQKLKDKKAADKATADGATKKVKKSKKAKVVVEIDEDEDDE